MPSKIQLDENLWFLYLCLQNSDFKSVDFAAVAAKSNLKAPAARMRFSRLKKRIEQAMLPGLNGSPFVGETKDSKDKAEETPTTPTTRATPSKKRKSTAGESASKTNGKAADEDERLEELGPVMKTRTRGIHNRVKLEEDEGEAGYLSSGESSEYGNGAVEGDLDTDDDFEDEAPMSKRLKSSSTKKKVLEGSSTKQKVQRSLALPNGGHQAFEPMTLTSPMELEIEIAAARDIDLDGHDTLQSGDQAPVTSLQTFSIPSPISNGTSQRLVLPKLESDFQEI